MKKLMFATMGAAIIFASSCKKDSSLSEAKLFTPSGTAAPDTISGEITADLVISRICYIKGIVYVKPGVTLTVNAGVVMTGSLGAALPDLVNLSNNKGVLVVEKGGRLNSNGTATNPVIWTSSKTAGTRTWGDWGGIVILGNAPIHTSTGATSNQYEAFNAVSDPRNSYGGSSPTENSGSITYTRIDFGGGTVLAAGREVNGLTLCGVGSGTTVHHVEVSNNGDDGFEFFGGRVNADHLLSFANKDDDFDFDEGYQGNLQFIVAYRTNLSDNSGSHQIETDNDGAATNGTPVTSAFIANATLLGPSDTSSNPGNGNFEAGIKVKRNTRLKFVNSLVIAQKNKYALETTNTTNGRFAAVPSLSDSIIMAYNLFQTNSAIPVANAVAEGDNAAVSGVDNALIAKLSGASNANGALGALADFKLDGTLKPVTGSPALGGGANLQALGLPFVGTTQRGGVITTDPWTSTGTWISIATN